MLKFPIGRPQKNFKVEAKNASELLLGIRIKKHHHQSSHVYIYFGSNRHIILITLNAEWNSRITKPNERETQHTSNGNIRHSTSATNIQSIREYSIQGFGDHGKVPRVLHQLQSRGMEIKVMGHVEVEGQPWEAPKTLNPIPKAAEEQHSVATHKRKPSSSAISLSLLAFSVQTTSWVVLQKRVGENADGF